MSAGWETTRRGRRRLRSRQLSTRALVTAAVVIAALVFAGLAAQAIVAHANCQADPVLVNVAVSEDIAPAIDQIARSYNAGQHSVAGRCAQVQVTEEPSAQVTSQIDGQDTRSGLPAVDAWIPDSRLWLDVARGYPRGAQVVQPTGLVVARSPLMLVMPPSVATATRAFQSTVGWSTLLPASVGGPPSSLRLHVDLPDPRHSAVGLATVIEMTRLLGTTLSPSAARSAFTKFALSAESTQQFGNPMSLNLFTATARRPLSSHSVTVTSEQAVIAYDRANPGNPLAARYPVGPRAELGSPELDYPYVLTASNPLQLAAARDFGRALAQPYATEVVRYAGFRSANGASDKLPASFGLAAQDLQVATPPTAAEVRSALDVWAKLSLGSRDLVLTDVSAAMGAPSGLPGRSVMDVMNSTSLLGLELFPDTTQMGLWEIGYHLDGTKPYNELVPVGPLPAQLGLISRRQQLQQIDSTLKPGTGKLALYSAILDGYRMMTATYKSGFANAVIVLTTGIDNAPHDITVHHLLTELRAMYNSNRKVEVVILQFGTAGNFGAMQQIAAATGGGAYQITSPSQVAQVFYEAVGRRMCDPNCVSP